MQGANEPEDPDGGPEGPTRAKRGSVRRSLLDAGRDMLVEWFSQAPGEVTFTDALGFLTPSAIARRAGVARGAFYHHWPQDDDGPGSFEQYSQELWRVIWGDEEVMVDIVGDLPDTLGELCRQIAMAERRRYDDPGRLALYKASIALAMSGAGGGPAAAIAAVRDDVLVLFELALAAYRRRPQEPWTIEHIHAATFAITEGGYQLDTFDFGPHGDELEWTFPGEDHAATWSPIAVATAAVVDAMTEPIPADERSD